LRDRTQSQAPFQQNLGRGGEVFNANLSFLGVGDGEKLRGKVPEEERTGGVREKILKDTSEVRGIGTYEVMPEQKSPKQLGHGDKKRGKKIVKKLGVGGGHFG